MGMRASDNAESRIIQQLRDRDPDGLAAAYDRYARSVYSLLVRITRDKSAAEDLLQELFLRVWNHARDFDASRGNLELWILTIARNIAIDYTRSAGSRFASRLDATEHLDALCSKGNPSAPESRITNVESIRKAFAALSVEEKRVMELAYFEGLSQSEIAGRLQQPLGTVKSRVRAALQRLRTALTGTATP